MKILKLRTIQLFKKGKNTGTIRVIGIHEDNEEENVLIDAEGTIDSDLYWDEDNS